MHRLTYMMMVGVVGLGLVSAGCGARGRVLEGDEPGGVGSRRAGTEVYNPLIERTTEEVLRELSAMTPSSAPKKRIAFIAVENQSGEELGDHREASYEKIDTMIVNSRVFVSINRRYVDTAMASTGMTPEDLFTKGGYGRFVDSLRKEGQAPDYLMWGKFTSQTTRERGDTYRDYMLTMEVIDAASGETVVKKTPPPVRKEYY